LKIPYNITMSEAPKDILDYKELVDNLQLLAAEYNDLTEQLSPIFRGAPISQLHVQLTERIIANRKSYSESLRALVEYQRVYEPNSVRAEFWITGAKLSDIAVEYHEKLRAHLLTGKPGESEFKEILHISQWLVKELHRLDLLTPSTPKAPPAGYA